MQDHSSKHRPVVTEKNHAPGGAKTRQKRKRFSSFLIETEFKPFVFVGRCMQYFGIGTVAGFFLGAVCVYGYASLWGLPYAGSKSIAPIAQPSPTPTQSKTIWLHGNVKNNDKPLTEEFEIGVLATRQGPFQDGSFSIQVPESDRYLITLWNVGYQRFKLVELKADSDGNVHDVVFPVGLARLERPWNKQRIGPANTYTAVGDKRLREKPNAPSLLEKTFANWPQVDKRSQL